MVRASARQNFDADAVASSRNFNDAMVRNRRFTMLISDRMEYQVKALPLLSSLSACCKTVFSPFYSRVASAHIKAHA